MVSKLTKKIIALIAVTSMVFVLLSGTVFAALVDKTLAKADGYAYFYAALSGHNVEAPDNFKVGFTANGSAPYYITSNIIAHTERIDKNQLIPNAVNTFTIYTGDKDGLIDEALSRSEAGTGCEEFSVTKSTLNLTLPNGLIILPSKLTAYKPQDNTTPLKDGYIASEVTTNVSMGDNGLNQAYKFEVEFDLTDVDWNPANDIDPILPDIKNVSLQIGAEPSSRNIVWYSTSEKAGIVQLALKADMTGTDFPTNAKTFSATSHNTGLTGYISYKATMTDLAENTEYVYRVGNEDGWSPAYSFKTQSFDGSFSFLAVSDPQLGQGSRFDNINDEIAGWTDTLDKAKATFPNAAFLTCMGDQVAKTYSDSQFDAFFIPESLKSFAVAAVVGNHDVGSNYAPHFNMPNLSGYGIQATMGPGSDDYWFTYGDALFMHINGISTAYDEHVKFMEETIEANPNAKWKFVMTHYGFYGATNQSYVTENIIKLREALAPEFSRLGIDVVLDGHEHCYSRSYLVNGFTETPNLSTGGSSVTDPDANEVLYLTFNSASGTDYVKPLEMEDLPRTAKVHQEYIPHVSNIDITDSSFTINTYRTSDMEIIDTFTINRTEAPGVKTIFAYPKTSTVKTGLTQTFSAKIFGYNNPSQEVIWSVSGNESPKTTINSEGVLSIDIDETAKKLVVTATSAANSSKSASVTVDVESNISEINVGKGVTYLLPTTVDGATVTQWTNQNGDKVTTADTSLVGYRFYTATLADGTPLKFRINVGEYKTLMSDNFEAYNENQYETAISKQALTGGTFTKPAYAETANGIAKLTKDGENTVAAFGPHTSAFEKFQWIPTDVALGEAFNVSYKLKVNTLDLDDVTKNDWIYFFTNNFGSSGCVQLRTYVTVNGETKTIGDTELYCTGTPYKKGVISNIEWTEPDENNVVSMKEY
ncbi:MAG: metallophosphoesterase family protein, partial [Clostridia bacterium]|nr:metallophosphoesterase family protein [Clostridia bacterium]